METTDPHPDPADWLSILEESDADLAAGRIVDGDKVIRELRATIAEMEREQRSRPSRGGNARP